MAALVLLFLLLSADILAPHGEKALVLLFIRSDCPISNRYAPELERLAREYAPAGIEFRLVYPEPGITAATIERHRKEYGYSIPGLLDESRQYVARAHARITPEAAVFVRGELVYRGRIDDRAVDLGKTRREASRHDLQEVLAAVAAGKTVAFHETKAVGCAIEGLP